MKTVIDKRQQLVVKSNKFIQEGRYSLSVQQQRILLYLISQIDRDTQEFTPCTFSIIDFCDLCGIDGKKYADIKATVKELADISYWIESEGQAQLKRWINSEIPPTINKGSGDITMCLSSSMKEYLLELREKFTAYELEWVLAFRRKYSIRLYEYISSRHFDKNKPYEFFIQVDELKSVMGADTYKRFADFHVKALAPAVEEIDSNSDKRLKYELIKKGKTVVAVKFTVDMQPAVERMTRDKKIQRMLGYDPDQLDLWSQEYYEK